MNQVQLIGRLTRDNELKNVSKTDIPLYRVQNCIAVDDEFTKDKTHFINFVAWGRQAEFLANYSHKGDLISIVGSLNYRTYTNDKGENVSALDVKAEKVSNLQPKKQEQQEERKEENQPVINREDIKVDLNEIDDDELPF